jgi:polysaccharide chain length determinant protein (PEP-CTERM system associated)
MDENERQIEWRDYWEVATRRRWVLLGALFACGVAATAGADLWPVRYRSEALVLVERQDVPKEYVQPNVTTDASERLASIRQQVLSRTRLESLIARYRLYPRDAGRLDREKLVDEMRGDIRVVPVATPGGRNLTAFRIEYTYDSPRVAQEVARELTSEFINESLEARTEASVATTNFLEAQLADAHQKLSDQQTRLARFNASHPGELPDEQQGNVQILTGLETQLYAESSALEQARQQRIYLESLAAAYRRVAQPSAAGADGGATPLAVIDKTIADLEARLAALQAKYTARYPDVVRAREQVAEWQEMRRKAVAAEPGSPAGSEDSVAAAGAAQPNLAEVQSRLKATQAEIAYHTGQIGELRGRIADTRTRLRLTPLRQQQLADLMRDYQNARDNYQSLLEKKLQSALATSLEKREEGERLRVVDPASLPQQPVSPNRLEIILAGWAAGLAAGVGVVAAEEMTDQTLRGRSDVHELLPCPLLAQLPVLRSPAGARRRAWMRAAEIAGLALLTLAAAGFSIYVTLAA